jgi:hypothetical protein
MGTMIEGPDRAVLVSDPCDNLHCDDPDCDDPYCEGCDSQYDRHQRQKRGRVAEFFGGLSQELAGIAFGALLVGSLVAIFQPDLLEYPDKLTSIEGRCFVTISGAKGVAESRTLFGGINLVFPSGLKESYDLARLDEISCDFLTKDARRPATQDSTLRSNTP